MTDAGPQAPPPLLRRLLPILVLVFAGALAYRPALDAPFLWDDEVDILGNARTRSLLPLSRVLGGSPRPVGQLSFAFDRVISGEGARGFHRTNVAIHVLAGLALFALLRRTFRRPAVAERLGEAGDTAAFVAALLWLLHPLHTSAVSLVVHRYESLMGLFFFAALALLAVAAESTRPAPWLALSAALSLAGMGTKEPMAAFPLVALLWDRTLWGGSLREALARRWGYYLALAGGWGLLVLLRFTAPGIASAGLGFEGLGPFDYLRSEAGVLLHYLRLAALPVGLTVDYYDWPVAHSVGQWLPQGLVVLALAAVGGWAVVRRRPEGIAAVAFFFVLAPTSTVIPLFGELAAERRMYVPLAAILALVVPAILLATRRLPESVVGVALLAAAVALGGGTFVRNRVFESAVSLWSDAVAKRPASARARNNLGTALDAVGEAEKAEASWREALRIDPRYAEARGNLAGLLFRSRRLDEADAELRAAAALDPRSAPLQHNLGLVAESRGRPAEAAAFYREAVRLDPESVGNLNDLAWLLATTPDPAVRSPAEAIGLARRAVELAWSPRAELFDTLAAALASAGRFDEAARDAERGLELARRSGDARFAAEVASRLEGYRVRRPFVAPSPAPSDSPSLR